MQRPFYDVIRSNVDCVFKRKACEAKGQTKFILSWLPFNNSFDFRNAITKREFYGGNIIGESALKKDTEIGHVLKHRYYVSMLPYLPRSTSFIEERLVSIEA